MSGSRRRSGWRWAVGLLSLAILILVGIAASAGFFDRQAWHSVPAAGAATGGARPVAALYFSGDMGLRFGPNPVTVAGLAQHGIPVIAISSPAAFRVHRSRAALDRIVADAVRETLSRTRARRLVVIGQSYGADVVQTGLVDLPRTLRARVAGIVLIVPGESVYFRADPSGLAYRGAPDSIGAATIEALDWAPLTCIYGAREADSACPAAHLPHARVIAMPGNHFLNHDYPALLGHVLDAIRRAVPAAFA